MLVVRAIIRSAAPGMTMGPETLMFYVQEFRDMVRRLRDDQLSADL